MTSVPVETPNQSPDGSVSMNDFMELMHSFNEVTQQLEHTHDALREQVASLQSDLAEANERLRRSRSLAALGEMAAGIAHEIRNPLGSIGLNVGLLREDVAAMPDSVRLCDKVARAVRGLDAIVGDVLSFARDSRPSFIGCVPGDLIEGALAANESLVQTGRIEVDARSASELEVPVDAGLVTQALTNVVRNACEAMVAAGIEQPRLRIHVDTVMTRTSADAPRVEHVRFAIEDNGPGIPAELRERIFNPFFTTRETGTGLGLAIVHRIVDAHDGALAIHDRDPGARVEMSFPILRSDDDLGEASASLSGAVRDRIQNHEPTRRTT